MRKASGSELDGFDESLQMNGSKKILIEEPLSNGSDSHPVNGNYAPNEDDDDVEATEDDLILGDEDELSGDEEEYDVELDDELDESDIDEDDLVIENDDDDDDEDDDL